MMRKPSRMGIQFVSFLFLFFWGAIGYVSGEELVCHGDIAKEILINKYGILPKEARGEIQYCRRQSGEFRARVRLEKLFPQAGYLLTLNGFPGFPGNEQLKQKCERRGDEGYCDFQTIVTDPKGTFDNVVRLNLEPGDYRVKFFVKNLEKEPRYQIVFLSDNPGFTVLARGGHTVEILSPSPDTQVEVTALIKGKVSDPKLNIYVFVHPLMTNLWWVQRLPSPPNRDGSWQSIAYFGTKQGEGVGEYFEIMAIAAPDRSLFKEGGQISQEKMMQIRDQFPHSDTISVKRVR